MTISAVMDHLGIDKFMVMGFCIGGPLIWNLLKRAPNRVVAAVLAQPSGWRPEMPTLSYDTNMAGWGPDFVKRHPEVTMATVDKFLTKMYRNNPDFVITVTRDFVRSCQTPVLILPDDIPAHPYAVAMEAAMLAPKAEVSMFPWKEPKERIPLAVRQITILPSGAPAFCFLDGGVHRTGRQSAVLPLCRLRTRCPLGRGLPRRRIVVLRREAPAHGPVLGLHLVAPAECAGPVAEVSITQRAAVDEPRDDRSVRTRTNHSMRQQAIGAPHSPHNRRLGIR
jgi:hypothetical protein